MVATCKYMYIIVTSVCTSRTTVTKDLGTSLHVRAVMQECIHVGKFSMMGNYIS